MRSWFYLILAYGCLIVAAIVAGQSRSWNDLFTLLAMGWVCKLESEK